MEIWVPCALSVYVVKLHFKKNKYTVKWSSLFSVRQPTEVGRSQSIALTLFLLEIPTDLREGCSPALCPAGCVHACVLAYEWYFVVRALWLRLKKNGLHSCSIWYINSRTHCIAVKQHFSWFIDTHLVCFQSTAWDLTAGLTFLSLSSNNWNRSAIL